MAAATLAAAVLSCSSGKEDPVTPQGPDDGQDPNGPAVVEPTAYSFAATPATLAFPGEGGTKTFQLTTEAPWVASCQEDWVSFGHMSGQGDDEIFVSVPANPDTQYARRATIVFEVDGEGTGSLEFEVTQEAGTPASLQVSVTTGEATAVTTVSATLSGSYSGATTEVRDHGFRYGTSVSSLTGEVALDSTTGEAKSFTAAVSSLSPGTTYYYQAYVTVWDPVGNQYVDFTGAVRSFKTTQPDNPSAPTGLQYLSGYEIPAVSLASTDGYSATGKESDCNTPWFNYQTTDDNQLVVTHTFPYNGKQYRNYTILIDKDKKAALWNAFVMHTGVYSKDNNVGRSGSWHEDPAVPSGWQSCFSSSGYSRGHEVASNYRQVCTEANKQTFYYTNQALQYQTSFNDGVWNNLENAVKAGAPSGSDTLYVVVGLLYEGSQSLSGVPVPSHFYKCLMKCSFDSSGKMTAARGDAYLFTNEAHKGMSYSEGRTTIDAMEQRSGFDFFANVPKELQDAAEKTSSTVF